VQINQAITHEDEVTAILRGLRELLREPPFAACVVVLTSGKSLISEDAESPSCGSSGPLRGIVR
jgi:hypothetical protein